MFESFDDWPEFEALRLDLMSSWQAMAEEARSTLPPGSGTKPWHEPEIYEGSWDVLGLFFGGRETERRSLAPTAKAVVGAWQPLVFNAGFSVLRPGAAIRPHVGYTSDVLRLHLGLVVPCGDPSRAGIRVGHETRGWSEGECLLFDDTQEHSAWNRHELPRVVLLVDLLRPAGREKRLKP